MIQEPCCVCYMVKRKPEHKCILCSVDFQTSAMTLGNTLSIVLPYINHATMTHCHFNILQ